MSDGHVNISRENSEKKQDESPTGEDLDLCMWHEQTDTAQQFENAAKLNTEEMERNPGRHDGEEESRVDQVDETGEDKKRGEEQTNG